MYRLGIFLLFLLMHLVSYSQEVEWGEGVSLRRSYDDYYRFDHRWSDRSFVLGVLTDRGVKAYEYDSTFRIVRNWSYNWKRGVNEFLMGMHRNEDSLELYVEEKSLMGKTIIKKVILYTDYSSETRELIQFEFPVHAVPELRFQRTQDGLYVWHEVKNNRLSDPLTLVVHSYTQDHKFKGTDTVHLPFRQREITLKKLDVEESGHYLLYAKIYDKNKQEKRGGRPNTYYCLLDVYAGSGAEDVVEIPLTPDTCYYSNFSLSRHDNVISYYGTYSVRDEDDVQGFIAGKVNLNTNGVSKFRLYPLPDSIINGFSVAGISTGKLNNFVLTNYINRSDELIFVLEKRYSTVAGSSGGRTLYEHHYRDILIVRTDMNQVRQVTQVEKYQKTFNDGGRFSSFKLIRSEDTLHILFNDRYEHSLFSGGKMTNPSRSSLVMVSVSPDGAVSRKTITDSKKMKGTLVVRNTYYYRNAQLLCFVQDKKVLRTCLFSIE